jgi:hypothetical protein
LSAREFLRTRFSRRPGSRELGCRPAALSRSPSPLVCTPSPRLRIKNNPIFSRLGLRLEPL